MAKGCCASLIGILLTIINVIFLFLGVTIFVIAAVLKWSKNSVLNKLLELADKVTIIDLSSITIVSYVLLGIGAFLIIVSLVGLIGACCSNRCFLVIYEVILIIFFLSHVALVLLLLIGLPDIEKKFKKAMDKAVNELNQTNLTPEDIGDKCRPLKVISDLFDCCGSSGASDFISDGIREICCKPNTREGCSKKVFQVLRDDGWLLIVIPNICVCVIELIFIIAVPFLIARIGGRDQTDEPYQMEIIREKEAVVMRL
jgi:hypothetical protein